MLFDIEDYRYWGLIGNSKVPEKKLPNKIGVQDGVPVSELGVDSSALFRWNFKVISRYFQSAIKVLPFHKKEDAVNAYFNYLDASREYSIKWDIFQNMLISLPVKSVTGGKQFVEGDLFYVDQRTSFQTPENEAVYLYTPNRGNSFDESQREYDKQYLLGVSFERVAVFVEDLNSLEEYYKTRVYTYVPLSETIAEEYYQSVRDLMASQKILLEKIEGMDVVLHEIPVPVKIDKIKFKHTLAVGGTFSGSIKTSTGYVKFVLGSEEFIFGDGTPSIIPFNISVLPTSKKSGYFFACDSVGEPIGDVSQIEIDATSELSSLNTSLASELTRLVATESNLTLLNLSKNTLLQFVDVAMSPNLATLNVSGCTLLEYLRLDGCSVSSLNLSGMTALEYLNAAGNKLGSIDFSGLTSLTTIDIGGNFVMPSGRTTMLSTLDSTGITGGTFEAPLEGLKPEAIVYYDSLIAKEWTLESDGVALPDGLYISIEGLSSQYPTIEYMTSTGYAKLTGSFGSIIRGGGSVITISDIDNWSDGQFLPWVASFDLRDANIHTIKDFLLQPCDVDGNVTGEIFGFGGARITAIDYKGVDFTKIKYINIQQSYNISSSLIESCVNLRELWLAYNTNDIATTIDLSVLNSEYVKVLMNGSRSTNLNLINYESLTSLFYFNWNTYISSSSGIFDISIYPNLTKFYFGQDQIPVEDQSITSIIATENLINMENINISDCEGLNNIDLSIIDPTAPGTAQTLNVDFYHINRYSNTISTFNLPLGTYAFYSRLSNLPSINYSVLYKIRYVSLSLVNSSTINSLSFDNIPTLYSVDIDVNSRPVSISFSNCSILSNIYVYSPNYVTEFSISNLPQLRQLYAPWLANNTQNGIPFEIDGSSSNFGILENLQLNYGKFSSLKVRNIATLGYCSINGSISPNNCGFDFTGSKSNTLNVANCQLGGTLNLTDTKFLTGHTVNSDSSNFTTLNLTNAGYTTGNSEGFNIYMNSSQITTMIGSTGPNVFVKNFMANGTRLTSIDFSGVTKLFSININNSSFLTSINVSGAYRISSGWGGNLTLSGCSALTSINMSNSNLGDINLYNCTNLTSLDFSTVNADVLRYVNCTTLQNLNSVTGLTNKYKLRTVNFTQTKITTLDLTGSSNSEMRTVRVDYTLFTPASTDNLINQIYASLPSGWGHLGIRNNRTSAGNAGFSVIQSKGWTISISF